MAKPSWLNVSPTSGNGTKTLTNSSSAHTGRNPRSGTVTVTSTDLSVSKTYTVEQAALAEFVSFDSGTTQAVSKSGGTVTVKGTSNSPKLQFSWAPGATATINSSYTVKVNGTTSSATNNTAISGDPGKDAQYEFTVTISNIPTNATTSEVNYVIVATTNNNTTKQITLKQAAGDAYVTITPIEVTIPYTGTSQTVSVSSNTTWSVE